MFVKGEGEKWAAEVENINEELREGPRAKAARCQSGSYDAPTSWNVKSEATFCFSSADRLQAAVCKAVISLYTTSLDFKQQQQQLEQCMNVQ